LNLLAFDSGIGGLGVVREIRRLAPAARITYLADTAGFPYGERDDDVLLPRVLALIGAGIRRIEPDAVVIACNTVSTIALTALRAAYSTPFIGCVPPVKPAARASRTGHVGLLATAATIRRRYLAELIDAHAGECVIHSLATPALAPLAEQKFWTGAVELEKVRAAVEPLFTHAARDIDAIALGCTHYTFLLPELQIAYPHIAFFDPAPAVAKQTLAITQHLAGAPPGLNLGLFTAMPAHATLAGKLHEFGFSQTRLLPFSPLHT
jgi:glutamate racemase